MSAQQPASPTEQATSPDAAGASDAPRLIAQVEEYDADLIASAELHYLEIPDGARLRVSHWRGAAPPRGTVLILGGFAEFIEKYYEVTRDLLARNWAVACFDWRGQGLSTRAHPQRRGWVADYGTLIDDVRHVHDHLRTCGLPQPLILLGHSMGGHLTIRALQEQPTLAAAAVVTAPMLGLVGLPTWVLRSLAATGNRFGMGPRYAPGATDTDPHGPHVPLSSDPQRIATWRGYLRAEPLLITHGATWRWVHEASRSMRRISRRAAAGQITTPLLLINPLADSLVAPAATRAFARHCPQSELLDVADSEHEILQERDELRSIFWQAFDDFSGRHCG